jgi:hypothetical protein
MRHDPASALKAPGERIYDRLTAIVAILVHVPAAITVLHGSGYFVVAGDVAVFPLSTPLKLS